MQEIIPLAKNTINNNEIDSLIEWLKTYPRLTQGPLVKEFEQKWSDYLNVKYSVFVNSGSSALLLSYYVLSLLNLPNKNIVTPGLSWATDLAPAIQLGFNPILCDCNLDDLSLDLDDLECILKEHEPSIVNLVSVLGLVPDMDRLLNLKQKYKFYLIEDVCESFGSQYQNQKLGTFGDISVFSLYFGHHLSTIEGGMICTNNLEIYNLLKMTKSHGWARELNTEKQHELMSKYNISEFSSAYTFYYAGFNFRGTDLQAKIGLSQMNRADYIIEQRNQNFLYYMNNLKSNWMPKLSKESFVSNFAFPVISKNKNGMVQKLQSNHVETRPLICGSMGHQPFYVDKYGQKPLPNCDYVDKFGLYVPNHPDLTIKEIDLIISCLN